jgi:UDPglucose--hexose-1-phosphate uridylyltransferase
VPNRFPAVDDVAQPFAHGIAHPLFESLPVIGGHEVLIESPKHIQSLSELSSGGIATVFGAFVDRLRYWNERPEIEYTIIFKNVGAAAGASLWHTHCQLVALSRLPPAIAALQKRLMVHRENYGVCLLCDMLGEERRQQVRIICETEHLVAFCPFASYLPYLVRITPRKHAAAFEQTEGAVIEEAGLLLRRMVVLLEGAFPEAAYNFFLQSCPVSFSDHDSFHWWIDLFPRISKQAGFEWGCHGQINPIPPEQAAQHIRRLDQLFDVTEREIRP